MEPANETFGFRNVKTWHVDNFETFWNLLFQFLFFTSVIFKTSSFPRKQFQCWEISLFPKPASSGNSHPALFRACVINLGPSLAWGGPPESEGKAKWDGRRFITLISLANFYSPHGNFSSVLADFSALCVFQPWEQRSVIIGCFNKAGSMDQYDLSRGHTVNPSAREGGKAPLTFVVQDQRPSAPGEKLG